MILLCRKVVSGGAIASSLIYKGSRAFGGVEFSLAQPLSHRDRGLTFGQITLAKWCRKDGFDLGPGG
jgi:hypothetical protein